MTGVSPTRCQDRQCCSKCVFAGRQTWCSFSQLELIVDSETGFASSTNILNLVDQLKGKKMRKKDAEHVLQKFVQNKWLIEVLCLMLTPARLTFRRTNSVSKAMS